MKTLRVIISIFIAFVLISCGASRNFSKQKYTGLKKIKSVNEPGEVELEKNDETIQFDNFEDEGSLVETGFEFDNVKVIEDEEINESENSEVKGSEEDSWEFTNSESYLNKGAISTTELSDESKVTITKKQRAIRITWLTILLLPILVFGGFGSFILLYFGLVFFGIACLIGLAWVIIGYRLLFRRINRKTIGYEELSYGKKKVEVFSLLAIVFALVAFYFGFMVNVHIGVGLAVLAVLFGVLALLNVNRTSPKYVKLSIALAIIGALSGVALLVISLFF